MGKAAREIVEAAKSNNYDQANKAAGEINKACSECHENYRA
jgi:cytochrome c556